MFSSILVPIPILIPILIPIPIPILIPLPLPLSGDFAPKPQNGTFGWGQKSVKSSYLRTNQNYSIMLRTAIIFGLLAGSIQVIIGQLAFSWGESNPEWGEALGYSVMLAALSMIYFGIRNQRDQKQGGQMTFGQGVQLVLKGPKFCPFLSSPLWRYFRSFSLDLRDVRCKLKISSTLYPKLESGELGKHKKSVIFNEFSTVHFQIMPFCKVWSIFFSITALIKTKFRKWRNRDRRWIRAGVKKRYKVYRFWELSNDIDVVSFRFKFEIKWASNFDITS